MKHAYNRGQITVYGCGIVAVSLILVLAVLQGVRMHEAKSRAYQTVLGAVKNLKGDYQSELFQRYHIFAVDETYYGRGEGYMEERIRDYLYSNLNGGRSLYTYDVAECSVSDRRLLTDDACEDFKYQINDYMKEKMPVDAATLLFGEFGNAGADSEEEGSSALNADMLSEMWKKQKEAEGTSEVDLTRQVTDQEIQVLGMTGIYQDRDPDAGAITLEDLINYNQEYHVLEDPRKSIASVRSLGILYFVMPDRVSGISGDSIDLGRVPSSGRTGSGWNRIIPDFTGMDGLKDLSGLIQDDKELQQFRRKQIPAQELYGIAYAFDSFSGVQNSLYQGDSEYHAFDYELEYILVGKSSDAENVKSVANRLLCIRLIPNLVYAFTDKEMKMQAETVATIICVPTDLEILIKPLTYVFLACWGYAESIMDVKALFQGERVPFIKTDQTWQLSITNIGNLAEQEVRRSADEDMGSDTDDSSRSHGLNYSEYLAVLLALMPNSELKYYRMLDIMELNIQESIPSFEMEHCMDEFRIQTQIQSSGSSWFIEGYGSYIR